MEKYIRLLIVIILLICPAWVLAQPAVQVLMLPFKVHADTDLAYLEDQVIIIIANHLEKEGATIVDPGNLPDAFFSNESGFIEAARDLGKTRGADAVVWGSMTKVGDAYSLDAAMLRPFETGKPAAFAVRGKGMENLSADVDRLARDIGGRLFKRERVAEVRVAGNNRIESDAVMNKIQTKPGDVFLTKSLSEDLKTIYAMGYFDDIRIESEDRPDGKHIVFMVKEKPTIRRVSVEGNSVYSTEEIFEAIDVKTGSILNVYNIKTNVEAIENLYREKNYHDVKVDYRIEETDNNQGDLTFSIGEGKKVLVERIIFEGNREVSDKQLKKKMKIREKGTFSWFSDSGSLDREDLRQDVIKLENYYHNNGYINAKVAEPVVTFVESAIHIAVKIEEGLKFTVGNVDITGELIETKEMLSSKLKIQKNMFFNRDVIRNDILTLSDIYADRGFAFADITPKIREEPEKRIVHVDYNIDKGEIVYLERILITGNTKTRDKIIRRELRVSEQDRYSRRKLQQSVRSLYRLDYFDDIRVETERGDADNRMILKFQVKEKPTGTFSFGGGYSSVENFFITGSISQRNLFGRGQVLQFKGDVGGRSNHFTLSFTEPWMFDIPLSFTARAYNWSRDYTSYDKESWGGGIRFGYPVFDNTRFYLGYNYELADVTNVEEDAAKSIKSLEGEKATSALSSTLRYDTRDRMFNPTEGMDHSLTVEYAGLGGDIAFTKISVDSSIFFPIGFGVTGALHGAGGTVEGRPEDGLLPDYERFYLGGMNSLRGFDWRGIHTLDEDGADIGGDKFVQFNAELIFPLLEEAGVMGVAFYDTGNVFRENENVDLGNLRESIGGGIRWYSPMGPMRLEYGYILNPTGEEAEKRGRWEFTIGTVF